MRLEGWPEVACSSWGCGCATATTNWHMTVGSSPVLQPKGVFGTFWLLAQQMLASSCELWFQTLPSPLDTAASSEQQEQGKLMFFLFVCLFFKAAEFLKYLKSSKVATKFTHGMKFRVLLEWTWENAEVKTIALLIILANSPSKECAGNNKMGFKCFSKQTQC